MPVNKESNDGPLPIGMPMIQLQKIMPNGELKKWKVDLMDLWQADGSNIDVTYGIEGDATQVNIKITNPYINHNKQKKEQENE